MLIRGVVVVIGVVAMATMVVTRDPTTLRAQGPVTFSEHVAPIVFANCTSCHRPGEAAPFSLMSYRDARPLARAIAELHRLRAPGEIILPSLPAPTGAAD